MVVINWMPKRSEAPAASAQTPDSNAKMGKAKITHSMGRGIKRLGRMTNNGNQTA